MRGWWRGFCDNAERRVQSTECLEREGTKGSEDAKREDAKSAKNCLLLASWRRSIFRSAFSIGQKGTMRSSSFAVVAAIWGGG